MYESKLLEVEADLTNNDDSGDGRSEGEIVVDPTEELDEWTRKICGIAG